MRLIKRIINSLLYGVVILSLGLSGYDISDSGGSIDRLLYAGLSLISMILVLSVSLTKLGEDYNDDEE